MRMPEDAPLESEQVADVVKSTQTKVERYYYELRKGLFDFDEVLAAQREDTYRKRDAALRGDADSTLEDFRLICKLW